MLGSKFMINSFSQGSEFLNNSTEKIGNNGEPVPFIEYEGIKYTNVTSAFLASQIRDRGLRYAFSFLSAGEAEKKFNEWKDVIPSFIDPSFEANKKDILFILLSQKFSDEFFLEKLLNTGENELIFDNSYGDTFLGVCEGEGENYLGKFLMEIRSRKRDELIKKESYIYSIGYGNLRPQGFLSLLKDYRIEILIDIRASTISHNKFYGTDALNEALHENNIGYAWCGNMFSEVSFNQRDSFDEDSHVIYKKIWNSEKNNRLKALCDKAIKNKKRICFLSAEFNPQHCHRGELIGVAALGMGIDICHIVPSKEGIKLLLQSELELPSELGISSKSYWGWSSEAFSIMETFNKFISRYLFSHETVLFQKLSEDKKIKEFLIEFAREIDKKML